MIRIVSLVLLLSLCCKTIVAQTPPKKPVKQAAVPKSTPAQKTTAAVTAEPWKKSKERYFEIVTGQGSMIGKLYDSTPLHRDNFIKLVQQKFYDSLLFHRVIDQFMIQGGDPLSKNAADGMPLGSGSAPGDRIPAEIKPYLFHKKGTLAAARDGNPEKASSNCQFYIVQGKKITEPELENLLAQRIRPANPTYAYTARQKEMYDRIGGTPFLDQSYTVYGEIISGLEVIDRIAKAPKQAGDRPLQNIRMTIKMLN